MFNRRAWLVSLDYLILLRQNKTVTSFREVTYSPTTLWAYTVMQREEIQLTIIKQLLASLSCQQSKLKLQKHGTTKQRILLSSIIIVYKTRFTLFLIKLMIFDYCISRVNSSKNSIIHQNQN